MTTDDEREAARAEALRMWPENLHLGQFDGVKIDSERAMLIQRQAFEMGVEWALDRRGAS